MSPNLNSPQEWETLGMCDNEHKDEAIKTEILAKCLHKKQLEHQNHSTSYIHMNNRPREQHTEEGDRDLQKGYLQNF